MTVIVHLLTLYSCMQRIAAQSMQWSMTHAVQLCSLVPTCPWTKAVPCAPVCLADVLKASSSMSDVHAERDIALEDADKHS
jgi:hypothetical protein